MIRLNQRPGFTLIELMTTVVLICVITGMCVVQTSFFSGITARSELYKLHAVCLYLQSMARSSGSIQQLAFTPTGYYFDGQTVTFASGVSLGCKSEIQGPPSRPTHPIKDACSFAHKRIDFHPDGIISSGVIYIFGSNGAQYALSSGVSEISCIRSYEYIHGWRHIY